MKAGQKRSKRVPDLRRTMRAGQGRGGGVSLWQVLLSTHGSRLTPHL
jgi:hypothetical protein